MRVTSRHVHNYVAAKRLTSRKEGRRTVVREADVYALAEELGVSRKNAASPPVEMLPDTGPLIDYIRELNGQAVMMSRRIGELESQLQQRLLPEDVAELRQKLARVEAERDLLLQMLKEK